MAELKKYSYGNNNSLWYEPIGDYYFSCLILQAEEETINLCEGAS